MGLLTLRIFIQSIVEDYPDNITGMPRGIRTVLVIISHTFQKINRFSKVFQYFSFRY